MTLHHIPSLKKQNSQSCLKGVPRPLQNDPLLILKSIYLIEKIEKFLD
jgi:hypothetical protein